MPHTAAWIVYVNGIEVPISSVNVEYGVWSIPTAQIRLVPHVLLQRIGHEDRLQVEIYYLDLFFDPARPQMCLMGEFEVIGWSYQNMASGRFIQFDCRAPLKILEQLRFYYMSSLADMSKGLSAPTATDAGVTAVPMVAYPYSLFNQGLVPDPNNPDAFISSPFEFVRNLLKALTDPVDLMNTSNNAATPGTLPRVATGVAGRNFFGRWMEMTDFRRRWVALPYFDDEYAKQDGKCFPIIKALKSTEVLETIQQKIGNSVGEAGTAWELLQRVFGAMYMEVLAVPAPAAVQLESKTNIIAGYFNRRGGGKDDKNYGGLASYMVKPQCIFGIPPACNVIFPSMIKNYSTSENYELQPTRIYLGESYVSSLVSRGASGDMQTLASELLVTGYPQIVKDRMQAHRENASLSTRNFLIYPEELYKGPVSQHMNAPPWLYMLEKMGQNYTNAQSVQVGGKTYARGKGIINTLERAIPAYGQIVKEAAKEYRLPEDFVWGVIGCESVFNYLSVSNVGAGGLMQTMQATFVSAYGRARKKNPKLPELGNHGPPKQVPKKNGGTRTVWNDSIYQDIFDPQKGLYAGIDELNELATKFGAVDFSLEEFNPKNPVPSLAQCVLIGYNAGPGNGRKLLKQRAEYFSKPESERDVSIFEKGWVGWENASGNIGTIAHWRVYSERVYRFQKAYLAYKKLGNPGDAASAPSTPQAPDRSIDPNYKGRPSGTGDTEFPPMEENRPGAPVETGANASTVENTATPANEAKTNVLDAGTPGVLTTTPSVMNATEAESALGDLFDLYAKYEYFRSRFESRTATATLAFNPYIIPGFNAVILDNEVSGFHSIGYVNSVSHSFAAQGEMQTTVVLSYVRTLPEYLKLIVTGSNDVDLVSQLNAGFDVGPTEVIPEVANVFQLYDVVNDFYQKVFYPGVAKGTPLSFDVNDFLLMEDMNNKPVSAVPDTTENKNSWTPDKGLYTIPTKNFSSYFKSYDAAMTFVSRPVATLRQTIELRHGKKLEELLATKNGEVVGPLNSFSDERRTAQFYSRIYSLIQPGAEVDMNAVALVTNTQLVEGVNTEGSWQIISASHNIPESRRNWDQVLINYRNAVRGSAVVAQL
jgi:hypothetical protein